MVADTIGVSKATEIILESAPGDVHLLGLGGSRAYGLEDEHSDLDLRGFYILEPNAFLGLYPDNHENFYLKEPDVALFELGKFARLAYKANPTALEILYSKEKILCKYPDSAIMKATETVLFLSERARSTYKGCAMGKMVEAAKLASDGMESTERPVRKALKHAFRYLQQGLEVLTDGTLTVEVANRTELEELSALPIDKAQAIFDQGFKKLSEVKTDLPAKADVGLINDAVLEYRWLK